MRTIGAGGRKVPLRKMKQTLTDKMRRRCKKQGRAYLTAIVMDWGNPRELDAPLLQKLWEIHRSFGLSKRATKPFVTFVFDRPDLAPLAIEGESLSTITLKQFALMEQVQRYYNLDSSIQNVLEPEED